MRSSKINESDLGTSCLITGIGLFVSGFCYLVFNWLNPDAIDNLLHILKIR